MATVAAGSRLVLHGPRRDVVLRTLRPADFAGSWEVPVMADSALLRAAGIDDEPYPVDVTSPQGVVSVEARLVQGPGTLMLRADGLRPAAIRIPSEGQRRDDVRADVSLPLRGAVLSGQALDGAELEESLAGQTLSVSAGGVSIELTSGSAPAAGGRVYLELELGGELAPAVLDVVHAEQRCLRGRFADISERDRERLVRLVFARQRIDLAERARVRREGESSLP